MKWRLCVLLVLAGLCSRIRCLPHQYHFISTALPWLNAQAYCRERYADLATVFNVDDVNRLVNTAQDSTGGFRGKAWIGLHDNLTSWKWSFSDSRYYGDKEGDYRSWDFGQPDNFLGDQMCVKMRSGGAWDDSPCFLNHPFVCYDGAASSGQRFVLVEQESSWSDAQLYCRRSFTDLASIRNESENQEIQQLTRNRSVWIGLFRMREWSDQSVSTYRNWKEGQPDNFGGKQNCTAADLGDAGLWSDEQCSGELPFICYGDEVETTNQPALYTTEMTITEGYSTSTEESSQRYSTPNVDQTRTIPEHVINLRLKLASERELSEDDIRELVSVQFRSLLIETGLPSSIEVGLKRPLRSQLIETEG